MPTFEDTEKRTWSIVVTVATIKRVKELAKVNLLDILDGDLIERLVRDPVLLCDAIFAICKPKADERKVSDEDFGRAMAGDAIDKASAALLEALTDFFPTARERANLKRALDVTEKAIGKAHERIKERLDNIDLDNVIDSALKTANASSGSAPESSESTPAP